MVVQCEDVFGMTKSGAAQVCSGSGEGCKQCGIHSPVSHTARTHGCTRDKQHIGIGRMWPHRWEVGVCRRCGYIAANKLTLTEKRGKRKPSLRDFLTSSSPWRTREPGSGAPSSDGQKNALPTLSRNTLLLRPVLSGLSRVAWEPTRRTRTRWSRTAEGVARRSRACSSPVLRASVMGMGLPSAYES